MSQDLFESEEGSASPAAYEDALQNWLAVNGTQLQHGSSAEMYEHMWGAWAAWAVGNAVGLDTVRESDIEAYLHSRGGDDELSPRYAWRLLRLIDRVLESHARVRGTEANRSAKVVLQAHPEILHANAAEADTLPEFLPAADAKRLVAYLSAVRPGKSASTMVWQEVRNRASVALMLGAGLTPGEVRALKTEDAVTTGAASQRGIPWKLRIKGNGNAPARETPIAGWAGMLLRHWLEIRSSQGIVGPMMFPSTRTGKPWSKKSQYDSAKLVLEAADIDSTDGGSFRLRHTFAMRQLKRGRKPDEIARWLGVSDLSKVMSRYLRVVAAPVDLA